MTNQKVSDIGHGMPPAWEQTYRLMVFLEVEGYRSAIWKQSLLKEAFSR